LLAKGRTLYRKSRFRAVFGLALLVCAAPALANLIYLPLSFASGLFMPLAQLPGFVQRIVPSSRGL